MHFKDYIIYIKDSLNKIDSASIDQLVSIIFNAFLQDRTIFIIGNGGSAANASHFAEDLTKGTCLSLEQHKRIKAFSLTDNTPWLTALSNDNGYEIIFEQQLKTFAKTDDLLIAISGSGNSKNIIKAIDWANKNNIYTVGITGFSGGKLFNMVKHNVHIALNDMCTTESLHSVIFHYIIIELAEKIRQYLLND